MKLFSYGDILIGAAPEAILVLIALVVLFLDHAFLRNEPLRNRFLICSGFACFGCALSIVWLLLTGHTNLLDGMLVVENVTRWVKVALAALTALTIVTSIGANFTRHVGEYVALILLSTVGMMFLASSEEILTLFVSLELTSLSLYVLTAFNKHNARSAEAALKYFLFGGMSAAFLLFGLSLIYGLTGETTLAGIAHGLMGQGPDPLLGLAMVMVIIGFGFKVAAVPFHLWAPDAYEGAPPSAAALIASGSKLASFFVLSKFMVGGLAGAAGSGAWRHFAPGWALLIAVIAAFSMVLGNLLAIAQTSVRRLLAYSAVAHAGYMLLGVLARGEQGTTAIVFYAATYGLAVVGAFAVVGILENASGGDSLADFAGFCKRDPMLSLCFLIFILSLAGIPPLAGFFGKFYLFIAAVNEDSKNLGLLWLVILAIGTSCISLYYYLRILKQVYVINPPAEAAMVNVEFPVRLAVGILALAVVVLGCAPGLFLQHLVMTAAPH